MEQQNMSEIESKKRMSPADVVALDLQQAPLSPEMAAYFAKCEEKLGYVPNVLTAYSHSMPKLETFAALYNELMLAPSGLTRLEREMIAVVVSAENRCWYCLVAHGAAVRALSGKPELGEAMAFNYRVAPIEPRQRAMLDFSAKMAKSSAEIEEADREKLRQAGFSDRDIWDIAAVASFYAMSNRMASAVAMKPNPEYHAQSR